MTPPICGYTNRINNRLVLKIKDRYKLQVTNALNNYYFIQKIIWQYKKTNRQNKNDTKCSKS